MADSDGDVKRLAEAVERLTREAANLRRDVRALAARFTGSDRAPDAGPVPTVRTVAEAIAAVAEARRDIRGAERDLASARAMVDSIAGDVTSREEMKGWLTAQPSGRKRGD